jgi:hypothetical protein
MNHDGVAFNHVMPRYPDPKGQDHWSHTVVPIVLAILAMIACLYCFNRILQWDHR